MLKVFEAFSGVGSQRMALRNLDADFHVVATSEIDKYAIISYGAIHDNLIDNLDYENQNKKKEKEYLESLGVLKVPRRKKTLHQCYIASKLSDNLGDISKINVDKIPEHDLFTYSFPCTDISIAGKEKGLNEGSETRSSLLWESKKVIENKKPRYLMLENVKNLVGKNHKENFDSWLKWLESQGYNNYWDILDATKHGIPQTRERVFVISILKEKDKDVFEFIEGDNTDHSLIDFLEENVDENFYYNGDRKESLIKQIEKKGLSLNKVSKSRRVGGLFDKDGKTRQAGATWDINGYCPTLDTMQGGYREPLVILTLPRGYNNGSAREECPTITTSSWEQNNFLYNGNSIRSITPKECWRLMGFKDDDFHKAQKFNSNTQLYKQAGNSIVVPVLESIFKKILENEKLLQGDD